MRNQNTLGRGRRGARGLTAASLLVGVVLIWSCGDGAAPTSEAGTPAGTALKAGSSPLLANAVATPFFGDVEVLLPESKHVAGRYGKDFRIVTITEGESKLLATFGWRGREKSLPGLVIISSLYNKGAKSCQNLGRYTVTEVANRTPEELEFLNTWLVTRTDFLASVPGTLMAALVAPKHADGKYDDAPDVVPSATGVCGAAQLTALGLASKITTVTDWQVYAGN